MYTIMPSHSICAIRYKPFLVAEVKLNDPAQPKGGNIDPAGTDKGSAFKQLAGFLGEKNERGQELSMTTPVFNKSKQGVMQFYIGEGYKVRLLLTNIQVSWLCVHPFVYVNILLYMCVRLS